MSKPTKTATHTGITMTVARKRLGISFRVLTRLITQYKLDVNMVHVQKAFMTPEQFQLLVRAMLVEERDKMEAAHRRVLKLNGLLTEKRTR